MDAGLLVVEPAVHVPAAAIDGTPATTQPPDTGGALPHGQSILPTLNALDPTPALTKRLAVGLTVLGMASLPCWPSWFVSIGGVVGNWDADHTVAWSGVPLWRMSSDGNANGVIQALLEQSLGVGPEQSLWALQCTAAAFGALLVADVLSEFMPERIRWPESWQTENRVCCVCAPLVLSPTAV